MASLNSKSVFSNGIMNIPVIGLGTWQMEDNVENGEATIEAALDAGYRHIDTANLYGNEAAIGNALDKCFKSGKHKREDIFVVTKLPPSRNRPELVEKTIKESLENLKLDYIDLYLIHWPIGCTFTEFADSNPSSAMEIKVDMSTDIVAVWKAMEEQVDKGNAKAIGLSNFNINQIKRILDSARIPPANLQIEVHVYFQQKELLDFCKQNNITVCAYAPLGSPGLRSFTDKHKISMDKETLSLSPLTDPVVVELAKKYGKQPGQILLRFVIQLGVAVIPKSTNESRIRSNIEIFDFEISSTDMDKLKQLDKGPKGRMFSCDFFKGIENHPEYPF